MNDTPLTVIMDLEFERTSVELLRRQLAIDRLPLSQALNDILKYTEDHEHEDYLIVGFSNEKLNPYYENSTCTLL